MKRQKLYYSQFINVGKNNKQEIPKEIPPHIKQNFNYLIPHYDNISDFLTESLKDNCLNCNTELYLKKLDSTYHILKRIELNKYYKKIPRINIHFGPNFSYNFKFKNGKKIENKIENLCNIIIIGERKDIYKRKMWYCNLYIENNKEYFFDFFSYECNKKNNNNSDSKITNNKLRKNKNLKISPLKKAKDFSSRVNNFYIKNSQISTITNFSPSKFFKKIKFLKLASAVQIRHTFSKIEKNKKSFSEEFKNLVDISSFLSNLKNSDKIVGIKKKTQKYETFRKFRNKLL